jgi:hypothetical protein
VKRWDLRSLAPSSKKQRAREQGADAPRVPRSDRQMPRVLFTSPECRAIMIDLRGGEELGDHHVRKRSVVEVVSGRISVEALGETVDWESGTLLTRSRGAPYPRAVAEARLLLLLALACRETQHRGGERAWPASASQRRDRTDPASRHDRRNGIVGDLDHPAR